ncbi:prolipoprotein diacylglyceryl transferase [Candidatus Gracilibacteria bacterium]|nr:prolipoprotein diacylglyceryl transferase [Candidatus Gracilibacteria bacterium]
MYVIGFVSGYYYILKKNIISKEKLDDLFFLVALGVILGGRVGYILFYDFSYYLSNPIAIFEVWKGGMSFHGGFLGVVLAVIYFSKKNKLNFFKIIDEIAVIVPIGIGAGRIGNYLNKELLGFSNYNGFLAVEKNGLSYFPSPLVEAFLEGIILFIILYFINKNKKFFGKTSAYFLIFYAIFRIFVEVFFRTPDAQIGYIFGFLTMGIILSIPMFLLGIIILIKNYKNEVINK